MPKNFPGTDSHNFNPVEVGQHLDFHSGQTLATIDSQVFMSQHL
jgi:hypothetical protein